MHGVAEQFSPEGGVDRFDGRMALSVKSAALALDITERQMWSLVGSGEIESFKMRGSRRIRREVLEDYINLAVLKEKRHNSEDEA